MHLTGIDGSVFELTILRYQFPEATDRFDANWLIVQTHVVMPRGQWDSVDPSLLTWEVAHLAKWFHAIARRHNVDLEEVFIEPNLRFGYRWHDQELVCMRVYFELESRPGWASADGAGMNDLWVELSVSADALRQAADELDQELQRFPMRR